MATSEEVKRLRLLVDEPTTDIYSDEDIADMLTQAEGNFDVAAAQIWEGKMAGYSTLVNTSESGSSRSLGDLYKNAKAQAEYFSGKVAASAPVAAAGRPRARRIKRV